jgi:hypothetical protein
MSLSTRGLKKFEGAVALASSLFLVVGLFLSVQTGGFGYLFGSPAVVLECLCRDPDLQTTYRLRAILLGLASLSLVAFIVPLPELLRREDELGGLDLFVSGFGLIASAALTLSILPSTAFQRVLGLFCQSGEPVRHAVSELVEVSVRGESGLIFVGLWSWWGFAAGRMSKVDEFGSLIQTIAGVGIASSVVGWWAVMTNAEWLGRPGLGLAAVCWILWSSRIGVGLWRGGSEK